MDFTGKRMISMKNNKIVVSEHTGEVKLIFDVRFYKASSILKAIDDFSEACWVSADGDPLKMIEVSLKPKSKEICLETLGPEFYNYVLSAMKCSASHQMV